MQTNAAPENFAQVDDIAQIDVDNNGTVDRDEFIGACARGLVHAPDSPNR